MRLSSVLLVVLAALSGCRDESNRPAEIRVLTDRTASHLQRIFDEYGRMHGVKVVVNFVDKGLLTRLGSRPTEADLIIVKNAYELELARRRGLLAQFSSPEVEANVPASLRDPERYYTTLSYRARVIFYSKERVRPEQLGSYADLAKPRWKGRICLRSGRHIYNLSLFSQLAASQGLDATKRWLAGLDANLARAPQGNDRAQIRAILEKKCDVALANSYYMGIMMGRGDQRAWAQASRVFFPDQEGRGAIIMRSAAALTKARQHLAAATKLLAWLTGDYAQKYFAEALDAYPVKAGVALAAINLQLGKEQGLSGGKFERNLVPLRKAVDMREQILGALDELRFDRAR